MVVSCVSLLVGGILIFQVRGGGWVGGRRRVWQRRHRLPAEPLRPVLTHAHSFLLAPCRAGAWTRCCCLGS